MDLVCETNVWYDIAAGIRSPARLKSGGNQPRLRNDYAGPYYRK